MTTEIDKQTGEIITTGNGELMAEVDFSKLTLMPLEYRNNCKVGCVKVGKKTISGDDGFLFKFVSFRLFKQRKFFNYPVMDWMQILGIDEGGRVFNMLIKRKTLSNFNQLWQEAIYSQKNPVGETLRLTFQQEKNETGEYFSANFKIEDKKLEVDKTYKQLVEAYKANPLSFFIEIRESEEKEEDGVKVVN